MAQNPQAPDGGWIAEKLRALAAFTDVPGQLTRLTLSPAHRAAAAALKTWFEAAGLATSLDALGTLVGRVEGEAADARTLLVGSHVDTVRDAGVYDGALGVIVGLAALDHLRRAGPALPFAVELLAFADEEGVRFPTTMTGSRALAGRLDANALDERDAQGVSRRQALRDFGAPEGEVAPRAAADTLGYVEVHIEQGPLLEAEGLPLGLVTAINGATRGEVRVVGEAGHAGTLPMAMRRDALAAAAEMILAIEARAAGELGLVATVGQIHVDYGAVNVVPGACAFSLDLRAPGDARRLAAIGDLRATVAAIAARRKVGVEVALAYDAPGAPCDPGLMEAMAQAMRRCGCADFKLASGAGHDAMAFRGVLPMAMLFVRCKGGVSHNPAEYASPEDMGLAARVLVEFLRVLAARERQATPP